MWVGRVASPVVGVGGGVIDATLQWLKSFALTLHVLPGKKSPDQLAGTHKTLNGQELTVEGSGEDFTVGDGAHVVCGNVETANVTVYIIDEVLMPKSSSNDTQNAELVALRVGQHHRALLALTDVDPPRAEPDDALDLLLLLLLLLLPVGRIHVDVQPVS